MLQYKMRKHAGREAWKQGHIRAIELPHIQILQFV